MSHISSINNPGWVPNTRILCRSLCQHCGSSSCLSPAPAVYSRCGGIASILGAGCGASAPRRPLTPSRKARRRRRPQSGENNSCGEEERATESRSADVGEVGGHIPPGASWELWQDHVEQRQLHKTRQPTRVRLSHGRGLPLVDKGLAPPSCIVGPLFFFRCFMMQPHIDVQAGRSR